MNVQEIVVLGTGCALVLAGLAGLIARRRAEHHKLKFLGLEIESASAWLVVLALGVVLVTVGAKSGGSPKAEAAEPVPPPASLPPAAVPVAPPTTVPDPPPPIPVAGMRPAEACARVAGALCSGGCWQLAYPSEGACTQAFAANCVVSAFTPPTQAVAGWERLDPCAAAIAGSACEDRVAVMLTTCPNF